MSVKFFNDKGRFIQVPTREAAIEIQPSEAAQAIAQSQPCVVRCSRSLLIFILKLVIFISILAIHYCLTRVISELLKYWIQYFVFQNSDCHLLFSSPFPATRLHSHSHSPLPRHTVTVTFTRSQRVPSLPFPSPSPVTSLPFAHTLTRCSGWPLLSLQSSEYWGLKQNVVFIFIISYHTYRIIKYLVIKYFITRILLFRTSRITIPPPVTPVPFVSDFSTEILRLVIWPQDYTHQIC